MKRKKKLKRRLFSRGSKAFWLLAALAISGVLLIANTAAWTSYTEWIRNHTQANAESIAVEVTEVFEQDSLINFHEDVEKSVRVKNMSERNAVIRVKFTESFLPFVLDNTDGQGKANGNLLLVNRSNEDLIDTNNVDTWVSGNLLDSGTTDASNQKLYYQATDRVLTDVAYTGEVNRVASGSPSELKYVTWSFNPEVYENPQSALATPYWVFDGTYFYYSQVLSGGEETSIDLLQSIGWSGVNVPNKYKNALYNVDIQAEGVPATQVALELWTSDSAYLEMYQSDSRFE